MLRGADGLGARIAVVDAVGDRRAGRRSFALLRGDVAYVRRRARQRARLARARDAGLLAVAEVVVRAAGPRTVERRVVAAGHRVAGVDATRLRIARARVAVVALEDRAGCLSADAPGAGSDTGADVGVVVARR